MSVRSRTIASWSQLFGPWLVDSSHTPVLTGPSVPIAPTETLVCCNEQVNPKLGETTPGSTPEPDKFQAYSPWTKMCASDGMVEVIASPSDPESWAA